MEMDDVEAAAGAREPAQAVAREKPGVQLAAVAMQIQVLHSRGPRRPQLQAEHVAHQPLGGRQIVGDERLHDAHAVARAGERRPHELGKRPLSQDPGIHKQRVDRSLSHHPDPGLVRLHPCLSVFIGDHPPVALSLDPCSSVAIYSPWRSI